MTRFSVVVPVRSAEASVDASLWSARRQTGADVEIIAVDDASPDACGAIIDRHARDDPRVTALHLRRHRGTGPARNAGLARASGEYVLFLDADDAFADASVLAGLDEDLATAGEPDVLLFDYEERRPCGAHRRVGSGLVAEPGGLRVLARTERSAVLRASWVCWNKAHRRERLPAGLAFPPGYYEDFAWSIPVLLAADRIGVSRRVGVHYRRCVATSTSRRVSARQLDVFDQFERVLAFLAAHPGHDSTEVREVLATGARTFLRSRTERSRVVPPDLLEEFCRRAVEVEARIRGGA